MEQAYDREMERQRDITRSAQQQQVLATQEGYGIMEKASVSLGSLEEEEEELPYSATGLMI